MAVSDPELLRDSVAAQLACPICYERLQTPVISPCSHSFCSVCIRNWLKVNKRCPVCNKASEPSNLIPNRILEPILKLIALSDSSLVHNLQSTHSDSDPNRVSCPKCSNFVAAGDINSHLDSCLSAKPELEKIRQRLPVVSLNIVSDKVLRNHLDRYRLSTRGTRPELEARWHYFAVLFEANEDCLNPAPLTQVVRLVEKQERARNRSHNGAPSPFRRTSPTSGLGDNSFDNLISQLHQQKKRKLVEPLSDPDQAMNVELQANHSVTIQSHSNQKSTTHVEDNEELPTPWRKFWSVTYDRPMYWNQETKEGTFRCPVTLENHQRSDSLVYGGCIPLLKESLP